MNRVIKNFMLAGIGGAVAYGVVRAVLVAIVTGTDTASVMFNAVAPIVVAAGAVWLIVNAAFTEG